MHDASSRARRQPLALVPALLALASAPAAALDIPSLRGAQPPYFSADLSISLDARQRPALSVAITVPYPELAWIRLGGAGAAERYAAGIEFTVVFESRRSHELPGDAWERRLVVGGFEATRSPGAAVVERRSFPVPPGPCQVRVGVRDVNSGGVSEANGSFEVPDYARMPVGFADLELGVAGPDGAFRPVPTRRFGMEASHIAARAALFDRRPGSWPRRYTLQIRLRGEDGEPLFTTSQEVTLAASGEPVLLRPGAGDLFIGRYRLEVELAEGRSRWHVERSFEVEESGPPRGREFERMLEPLAYIASGEEIAWLRSLPVDEQARGWEEFWRRRDPTPETARNEYQLEFFRRLRFVEQRYGGFGPGWRSDRGRIYIKFGPPDQVESRPPTAGSIALEVWYYNQPYRRFVFGDREGFGRFVLLQPGVE